MLAYHVVLFNEQVGAEFRHLLRDGLQDGSLVVPVETPAAECFLVLAMHLPFKNVQTLPVSEQQISEKLVSKGSTSSSRLTLDQ